MSMEREGAVPTRTRTSSFHRAEPKSSQDTPWARIGYHIDEKGDLVPLDRDTQVEFTRMIRDIAARRRRRPRPN